MIFFFSLDYFVHVASYYMALFGLAAFSHIRNARHFEYKLGIKRKNSDEERTKENIASYNYWVPDEAVTRCTGCEEPFTFFLRRVRTVQVIEDQRDLQLQHSFWIEIWEICFEIYWRSLVRMPSNSDPTEPCIYMI
jgi:hypothetical protein